MARITYCYSVGKNISFSLISRYHIKYLRERGYHVVEVDVDKLRYLRLLPTDYVILHPLFYPLMYAFHNQVELRYQVWKIRSTMCRKIVVFETADSDRLSDNAVYVANNVADVIIVPSEYAKRTFIDSGVNKKIVVIPHGVDDVFFDDRMVIRDPELYILHRKYSDKKKILYFCMHSAYRKGKDLVEKAIARLRKERSDFMVICKYGLVKPSGECDYVITRFLDPPELKTLYDIADIVLVPSRGGGFECNALESLIRYRPVVYPKESCIEEYASKVIPELGVKIASRPVVLPNNPIHVGRGHEVDLDDFIDKIHYALDNVDELKARIKERFKDRERYRWRNIVEEIVRVIEDD